LVNIKLVLKYDQLVLLNEKTRLDLDAASTFTENQGGLGFKAKVRRIKGLNNLKSSLDKDLK